MTTNPRPASVAVALILLLTGASALVHAAPQTALSAGTALDPLLYSTFIGGRCGSDRPDRIAVDSAGNVYIAGTTCAKDFPTTAGAFNRTFPKNAVYRMFVAKISAGRALSYSTFLGGSSGFWSDDPYALVVDAGGSVYLAGLTNSSDFPATPGSYQPTYGGNDDGFVLKLSPDGSSLVYATFLGGGTYDGATALALDAQGNAYVTGWTSDHLVGMPVAGVDDFPTTSAAFDRTYAGNDEGWVAKISPDGRHLLYSTFLGGSGDDVPHAIQVDGQGDAFVGGETSSPDFPVTPDAFSTVLARGSAAGGQFSNRDAFVSMLNPDGSGILYSTFYGGAGWDSADNLVIDSRGHAYIAGLSTSSDLPVTAGAVQRENVSFQNAFVAEFSLTGTDLLYSTYLGGGGEYVTGLALGSGSEIVIGGITRSESFPATPGGYDTARDGSEDGFVSAINLANGTLAYSTLLGGQGADEINALALDAAGHAIVFGWTDSADYPLTADHLPYPASGWGDLFVTELALAAKSPAPAPSTDWPLVAAVVAVVAGAAGLAALLLVGRRPGRAPRGPAPPMR